MKSKEVSLKKNIILNFLLSLSSFVFPLISFPYVTRVLGPGRIGQVSFATSIISYFLIIAQLGIPTYGIRACAQVKADKSLLQKTFYEFFCLSILTTLIAYIMLAVTVLFVPKLYEQRILIGIISMMIIGTTLGVEWFYKALEMYDFITWRSLFFKVIALIGTFLLIHKESDYLLYGFCSIFAAFAASCSYFIHLPKLLEKRVIKKLELGQHLKPIFVFFAMSCATTIYLNLDTTMLGFMVSDEAVGYYRVAVNMKTVLVCAVTSLAAVLLPRASIYVKENNKAAFDKMSSAALQFTFLLAVPLVVYFMMYAKPCVVLLSGMEFLPASVPTQIMMPTLLLIGLTNVMGIQILVALGRENIVLLSVIVGAVVDLVFNMLLIPRMGIAGAAIGTLLAELTVLLVQYVLGRDYFGQLFRNLRIGSIVLATAVGGIGSYLVADLIEGIFMKLVVTFLVFSILYVGVLYIFKDKVKMNNRE